MKIGDNFCKPASEELTFNRLKRKNFSDVYSVIHDELNKQFGLNRSGWFTPEQMTNNKELSDIVNPLLQDYSWSLSDFQKEYVRVYRTTAYE